MLFTCLPVCRLKIKLYGVKENFAGFSKNTIFFDCSFAKPENHANACNSTIIVGFLSYMWYIQVDLSWVHFLFFYFLLSYLHRIHVHVENFSAIACKREWFKNLCCETINFSVFLVKETYKKQCCLIHESKNRLDNWFFLEQPDW